MGFLQWEIWVTFPGESQLRQSRTTQPTVRDGCSSVSHNPPNPDMDYRIFNLPTNVNAHDCTRVCADTVRESALKADSGRKIPCRTGESNPHQRCVGPMLYQLSYKPTPFIYLFSKQTASKKYVNSVCRKWECEYAPRLCYKADGRLWIVCCTELYGNGDTNTDAVLIGAAYNSARKTR